METLKVVLDFTDSRDPKVVIGEPKDFKPIEITLWNGEKQLTYSNLISIGPLDWGRGAMIHNDLINLLEGMLNRTYALLFLTDKSIGKILLRTIRAKKIIWYQRTKNYFLRDKPIPKKNLRKQIQHMKRIVKEFNLNIRN